MKRQRLQKLHRSQKLCRSHVTRLAAEAAEVPVYESVCDVCSIEADYLRPVAECMDTPVCISCGERMRKVIRSAPKGFINGKFEPFVSHVDGSLITTQREMAEHNKRNNVVSMADGYDDATVRRGDFVAPEKRDINDLKSDIAEATAMVNQGYKPNTEVYGDD